MQSPPLRKTFVFDDPLGFPPDAVAACADAGFEPVAAPWPLVDPSEYFIPRVADFSTEELAAAQAALIEDGVFADAAWTGEYLARDFAISETLTLRFTPDALARIAVKFGWAIAFAGELAAPLTAPVEFVFNRTSDPATPLEHLFIALELRRRALPVAALALRWPGEFEPAVEYVGDAAEFERAIAEHAAVARFAGAHKLSFPHGEEKFAVLPAMGRQCGELLHFQTARIGWMEAMRTLTRSAPDTFRDLLRLAQEHFVFDKMGHSISTSEDDIRFLPDVPDADLERTFLEDPRGRQLLHITAPSLVDPVRAALAQHHALHRELLAARLAKHLRALTAAPDAT